MGKVRVALIGAGGIANGAHLPSLSSMEAVELVAVCDLIPDRAAKAAERFGILKQYVDFQEMLRNETLDAVYVLTEPDRLFRPTVACLQAGKHVFMEKPPGITTFQAEGLSNAARQAGRILMVGFNRRYIPLVRRVVEIMRQHTLITQVEARFVKHGEAAFYGGSAGALECDVIHAIDLVRWLAGGIPVSAAMVEGQDADVVPNRWNAVARFESGITGVIRSNYMTGGRVHSMEMHGPGGSAYVNLGFGDSSCDADLILFGGQGTFSIASAGPGKVEKLHLDAKELSGSGEFHVYYGFAAEDEEFISCVQENRRPLTDIEEGVRTMKFIDMLLAGRI